MAKAPLDIRSLARQHTETCIRTLSHICAQGDSASARVAAAVALLDRGWGKPEQSLDLHDSRELRQYSDAELIAIIAAAQARRQDDSTAPGSDALN